MKTSDWNEGHLEALGVYWPVLPYKMRNRLVVVGLVVMTLPVAAQNWTPPKTPWGDPDLQGFWPSVDMLSVPFERPVSLGLKATLTDEEFARLPPSLRAPNQNEAFTGGGSWALYMEKGKAQRQTSLLVDPPDGRMPPRTAEGEKKYAAVPTSNTPRKSPETFSLFERCISRGALGSMIPLGNTNGNQIFQTRELVVILNEAIHEARLIPLDGRPHLGPAIRSYMGDSRGRWEGRTLVVDTINFNDNSNQIPGAARQPSYSRDARLTERFTRIDEETIQYEATVDDPTTWTRPWTVAFLLKRDPGYYLLEYACHAGNYSMPRMLRGARLGVN